MLDFILFMFFLLVIGITLWVVGAKRRGSKGARLKKWMLVYISGLVITAIPIFYMVLPFFIGLGVGFVNGFEKAWNGGKYNIQAKKNLKQAKINHNLQLANLAIKDARKSINAYPTDKDLVKSNEEIIAEAKKVGGSDK